MIGLAQLCGADTSWSPVRVLALIAVWGGMSAIMMLPCGLLRAAYEALSHRSWNPETLRDHASLVLLASLVGGVTQWSLESIGAMSGGVLIGGAMVQLALLVFALAALAGRLQSGSRGASVAAMVSLQFAGGAMNTAWMLVGTACMLALTIGEILLTETDPSRAIMRRGALASSPHPTA